MAYAQGWGYSVQKILYECAANMGSKISLLLYEWPLIKENTGFDIWMGIKIFPNLSQNWLKFEKKFEKFGDFAQNLNYIWMDHFFLKNRYLYGSTFKFRSGTSLSKPNLSPPGLCLELSWWRYSYSCPKLQDIVKHMRQWTHFYIN